jgi:MFS family permease
MHGCDLERQTFRFHLLSSLTLGASWGVLTLLEVIAKKSLGAQDWHLTALVMAWPVANLTSVYWARWASEHGNLRPYVLAAGLGRAAPLAALVVRSPLHLVPISLLFNLAGAFLMPVMNNIFRNNYAPKQRGKLFGYCSSAATLTTAAACYGSGHLLGHNEQLFRLLLAAAGILGFLSCWFIARIPLPRPPGQRGIAKPTLAGMVSILRDDAGYRRYECNFFVYGIAFIMLMPILPIFLVQDLSLSYSSISLARGIAVQLPVVLLSPLAGRLHDRESPPAFAGRIFLVLALFPLLLLPPLHAPVRALPWVLAAFLLQGFAMAGVNVVWTLGSIYFAGPNRVATYHGIHVSLTGVRGLIAPLLALSVYRLAGTGAVFVASSVLFAVAGVLMTRLGKTAPPVETLPEELPALQPRRPYHLA